jgi:hypothetical protein
MGGFSWADFHGRIFMGGFSWADFHGDVAVPSANAWNMVV